MLYTYSILTILQCISDYCSIDKGYVIINIVNDINANFHYYAFFAPAKVRVPRLGLVVVTSNFSLGTSACFPA